MTTTSMEVQVYDLTWPFLKTQSPELELSVDASLQRAKIILAIKKKYTKS